MPKEISLGWIMDHNKLILCNNLGHLDYEMVEDAYSQVPEDMDIAQWWLTDLPSWEAERLKKYDLILVYSNLLDKWVIAVTCGGTSYSDIKYRLKEEK